MKITVDLESIESIVYKMENGAKVQLTVKNGEMNITPYDDINKKENEKQLAKERFNMLAKGEYNKCKQISKDKMKEMDDAYKKSIADSVITSKKMSTVKDMIKETCTEAKMKAVTQSIRDDFQEIINKAEEKALEMNKEGVSFDKIGTLNVPKTSMTTDIRDFEINSASGETEYYKHE